MLAMQCGVAAEKREAHRLPTLQEHLLEQASHEAGIQAKSKGAHRCRNHPGRRPLRTSNRFLLLLTLLSVLCLLAIALRAQTRTTPMPPVGPDTAKTFTPTEIQSLRLQVRQKDALLAKKSLDDAQKAFQESLKALTDEAEVVKKENGWSKELQFDPNTITFSAPTIVKEDKPK